MPRGRDHQRRGCCGAIVTFVGITERKANEEASGDEFVMVLSKLDVDKEKSAAQAGRLADAIRIAIAKPYLLSLETNGKAVDKIGHQCTTSTGIVLFKAHEISVEEIMIRADLSMYQAKANGRNSISFHQD